MGKGEGMLASKESLRSRGVSSVTFLFILFVAILGVGGHNASAADIDALAKDTDKQLRTAERLMHNGKNLEASELLEQAAGGIETLKTSGYGRARSLESKYLRTKKAVDRKLAKSGTARPAASPAPGVSTSASSDKLPGGVSKRMKDINRELDLIEKSIGVKQLKSVRYKYEGVQNHFDSIQRQYGGQFSPDHPQYKAAVERYAAVGLRIDTEGDRQADASHAAAGAQEEMAAKSDLWLQKFAPYMSAAYYPSGHKPSRPLIYPGTSQPELYAEAEKRYEELKEIYDEFLRSGFPEEKPWPLSQAVADVKYALENYESSMEGNISSIVGDAEKNIDQAMVQVTRNQEWKTDKNVMPDLVDEKWLERIAVMVEKSARALKPGDPQLTALEEKFAELKTIDQQHRTIRADRRFVKAERYQGKDRKELQREARRIVASERNNPKILQVSIYSDEWKEESVREFTDTTKTAVRHRVTRMINAQVAAEQEGRVMLHTLHIAKDKKGNDWGRLYGHIMYSDPMAAKNVGKKGP